MQEREDNLFFVHHTIVQPDLVFRIVHSSSDSSSYSELLRKCFITYDKNLTLP